MKSQKNSFIKFPHCNTLNNLKSLFVTKKNKKEMVLRDEKKLWFIFCIICNGSLVCLLVCACQSLLPQLEYLQGKLDLVKVLKISFFCPGLRVLNQFTLLLSL